MWKSIFRNKSDRSECSDGCSGWGWGWGELDRDEVKAEPLPILLNQSYAVLILGNYEDSFYYPHGLQ
jgi:hypothetical protein